MGGALSVHLLLEVQLAATLVDVDGAEVDSELEALGLDEGVDLVAEEEDEHNRGGKVSDEERLDVEIWSSDRLVMILVAGINEGYYRTNLRRGRRRKWR